MKHIERQQLSRWTGILTAVFLLFASCQSNTEQKEKELLKKENKLLKRENELLKKESSQEQQTEKTQKIAKTKSTQTKEPKTNYSISKTDIEQAYKRHLKQIEGEGRDCGTVNTFIGDINGDGLNDGVAHFGCSIKGNPGNASAGSGLAIFINKSGKLEFIGTEEDYLSFVPSKISSGLIYGEQLDYGPDDPRCCPSIKTKMKLRLVNSSLVKVN